MLLEEQKDSDFQCSAMYPDLSGHKNSNLNKQSEVPLIMCDFQHSRLSPACPSARVCELAKGSVA